jgi:hypothetical protein
MRQNELIPKYVESFPEPLEDGYLYISRRFRSAAHNCCCGCGREVVTALKPASWTLTEEDDGTVSLWPSIGNWSYPCRSHYVIRQNKVCWCGSMTERQIQNGRAYVQAKHIQYVEKVNRQAEPNPEEVNAQASEREVATTIKSIWHCLFDTLGKILSKIWK